MNVKREQLLRELELVKPGLSAREYLEQSSCFVFDGEDIMTFNDEISCRLPSSLKITGAIQATSLQTILEKMDDEVLQFRETSKGELQLKGKNKMIGLTKDAEVFLPVDKVEKPGEWKPLPAAFTEAVGLVQHCVSEDESKFVLTCIHLHPKYLEACDNQQLMRYTMKTGLTESVLVRGASLKQIVSMGMDAVSITPNWIHFRNGEGLVLSVRKYDETYHNIGGIIDFSGHKIVIPKGLKEAALRAAVFAEEKSGDSMIKVSLSTGSLKIIGEGLSGWYKEGKKVAYEGPPMSFVIAPELLQHVAEKYQEAEITDEKLKVVGGKWVYVTVLGASETNDQE